MYQVHLLIIKWNQLGSGPKWFWIAAVLVFFINKEWPSHVDLNNDDNQQPSSSRELGVVTSEFQPNDEGLRQADVQRIERHLGS
jgi:hypothetical protein